MIFFFPVLRSFAAAPKSVGKVWRNLEGKTLKEAIDMAIDSLNPAVAQLHYINSRGNRRTPWWGNPLGYGLVAFGVYKVYHLVWITPKQLRAARTVADAYGQGGLYLEAVPV
eukprot:Trichotokara_eunicae@DN5360_c0_g1_i4.p1